jgi:RNA-directed DNA polymerase
MDAQGIDVALCPSCHQALDNGEEVHVHHMRPKHHGGTDDLANLRLVH